MIHVAWWTFALLAAAQARIYSGCELARDLEALGVRQDHISTWVCIAYHESRFDTAARNPHSGDHGIFQISELYWCGGGKVCGLSCEALRDDNIADDVQCARQVHEEHTRLQGDGFLAWVVYPQHCKSNTKKYLAECNLRGGYSRTSNTHSFSAGEDYTVVANKTYQNTAYALPSFFVVSSIFQERYGKALDYNKDNSIDWYNYKYDGIDDLKLPDLKQKAHKVNEVTDPELVTKGDKAIFSPVKITTTTYTPPVKPWRFIETNQFRKKHTSTPLDTTTVKSTTKHEEIDKITVTLKYSPPATESTTQTPVAVTRGVSSKVKSTTASYNSPAALTKSVTTTNITYKFPTFTTSYRSRTTSPTPAVSTTQSWWQKARTTTPWSTVSPTTSTTTSKPRFTFTNRNTSWLPTTTVKYPQVFTYRSSASSTVSPFWTSTTTKPEYTSAYRSTKRLPTTTVKYSQAYTPSSSTKRPPASTTQSVRRMSRSTQSIWDLYLNPTKAPSYQPFNFSRADSKYKINIFSGGTTTVTPTGKASKNMK